MVQKRRFNLGCPTPARNTQNDRPRDNGADHGRKTGQIGGTWHKAAETGHGGGPTCQGGRQIPVAMSPVLNVSFGPEFGVRTAGAHL